MHTLSSVQALGAVRRVVALALMLGLITASFPANVIAEDTGDTQTIESPVTDPVQPVDEPKPQIDETPADTGDGTQKNTGQETAPQAPTCGDGEVLDAETQECVLAEPSVPAFEPLISKSAPLLLGETAPTPPWYEAQWPADPNFPALSEFPPFSEADFEQEPQVPQARGFSLFAFLPLNQGDIRIEKTLINDNGGTAATTSFSVTVYSLTLLGGYDVSTYSFDAGGLIEIVDAPLGLYHIVENDAPGYDASHQNCSAFVMPLFGSDHTCSITNDDIAPPAPVPPTGLYFMQSGQRLECGGITNSNASVSLHWDAITPAPYQYVIVPDYPDNAGEYHYFPPGAAASAWIGDNFANSAQYHGEGVYSYVMRSQNVVHEAWSVDSDACTLTYDKTGPVVTVSPLPEDGPLSGVVTFTITVTDNLLDLSKLKSVWTYLYNVLPPQAQKGAKVNLSVGTEQETVGTFTVDTRLLANGTSTLDVARIFDAAGNASGTGDNYFRGYVIHNVPVDTIAPAAPQIIFPTNGQVFATAPILNDWTDVTDESGIAKYEIEYIYSDGHTFSGGPFRETAGNVSQRNHAPTLAEQGGVTIRVRAYDNVGNVSDWSNSVYYIYDVDGTHVSRIIKPAAAEVVSGLTDLEAFYADQNGDGNDSVQWAVRAGSCSSGVNTKFGNVDEKSNPFTWNGADFSATIDTTTVANGEYCFVLNPNEDTGNIDQRLTRTFTIDNGTPSTPVDPEFTFGTTTVTSANMQGWAFVQETATGAGSLVAGPLGQPMGTGSANLIVNAVGGMLFGAPNHAGVRLSNITTLSYSTFRSSGGPALAPSIQLNIDKDVTDANVSWQGRLVYEPYYTQTVDTGSWQEWDALNDAAGLGTGNWWFSDGGLATESGCTQTNPCTWAEVLSAYSNIGIHLTLGAVGFKAGSNWAGGFDGNVDKLIVGIKDGAGNVHTETYDFEPTPPSITIGGGGGSSSSSFSSLSAAALTDEEVLGASTECGPLLTSFLSIGGKNDASEVSKLQTFLNTQGLGVILPVTGIFGQMTFGAVKAFQTKYWEDVLLPWFSVPGSGISSKEDSTGHVYQTTKWKINDLWCPGSEAFPEPLV